MTKESKCRHIEQEVLKYEPNGSVARAAVTMAKAFPAYRIFVSDVDYLDKMVTKGVKPSQIILSSEMLKISDAYDLAGAISDMTSIWNEVEQDYNRNGSRALSYGCPDFQRYKRETIKILQKLSDTTAGEES